MQAQLTQLEADYSIEWQDYRLGELFDIQNTLSFNKDKLTQGTNYDYVTRTSQNQGILQQTGFVNKENINPADTWSLGLLQMDFFYRQRPWYAGQFVRKIASKIKLSPNAIIYFTTLFNRKKQSLLSVLVRDVDKVFLNAHVSLPAVTKNGKTQIAVDFMEAFIATLKAERLATLKAYLTVTGLTDTTLTPAEQTALDSLDALAWGRFRIEALFDIRPTKNYGISNKDLLTSKGSIPVVSNTSLNNGITAYVALPPTEKGNIITFSDTTTDEAIFYQPHDFVGYSHVQGMYKKFDKQIGKSHYLFLISAFKNAVHGKYNYGNKFNRENASNEIIQLPITDEGRPDYYTMSLVVSALQKVVIRGVVSYLDARIETTAELV